MKEMWADLALILSAYGLGCLNAAYYLARWKTGGDIRKSGSGTAGARNVSRMLGRGWSTLVFVADFIKGVLVAAVTPILTGDGWALMTAVVAVVGGHVWPAQLGFRGGKGVATSLGVLTALGSGRSNLETVVAASLLVGLLWLAHRRRSRQEFRA
jgi:acyl phosphate:glycerol-3-phosphate acyltransferase